jgi:hypothetical protein
MTESIICPICKETLKSYDSIDATFKMYSCRSRKVQLPNTDVILNSCHYSVRIDASNPSYLHKVVELLPYIVETHKDGYSQYTKFTYLKVKPPVKKLRSSNPGKPAKTVTESIILRINKAVNWDFSNRDNVIERIKLYMVFT